MSIIRTAQRSSNYKTNKYTLRSAASVGTWPSAPSYSSFGGTASSAGTTAVSWPTEVEAGQLGIMVVETSGNDTTISLSGWTHFAGSPIFDVADATGSKLNVLWKFASSSESAISIPDVGDHFIAKIFTFTNVSSAVSNFVVSASTKTTASTTVTWPSLTSRCPNTRLVLVATRPNSSTSTTNFSGYTNTNLTSITEAAETGSVNGDGGGFTFVHAGFSTLGATGTTTATSVASTTNVLFMIALEPTLALPA